MTVTEAMTGEEIITDFQENYAKVRKLLDEDSKNDPENEPYLSKYKAKDILVGMRDSLKKIKDSETSFDPVKLDAMLGLVLMNIGVIHMETEELKASQDVLSEAADLLSMNSVNPEIVVTLINVYNNLGILWSNRQEPEKAKKYLMSAKELYEKFKCSMEMPVPVDSVITSPEGAVGDIMLLEKIHTHTLYYLAQVYGNLKENLKSAIYCHITLRRQLQYTDYDPIDWSLNCATLSQFFAEQSGFFQSRHHLAAASKVLEEYEEKLRSNESQDEAHLAKIEQFKHRSADVARCWAKYCLQLMSASKARLMTEADELKEAITDMSDLNLEDDDNIFDGHLTTLVFDINAARYESRITDEYLLTYSDAREVFLACQMWINKAKEYYKLETLASDYIELIQDCSQSYSNLAFFEEDDERRAKMHKRRVDMLEDLIKEINPTYYLQYCRQLWYELGEAYSEILNIKLEKLNNSQDRPSPHALKKINTLCEKTIENYGHFVESVKDTNGMLPEKLSCELIRPVISAYGFIGRNSMKRIAVDKNVLLSHLKKSLESYEAVVDICTKDSEAAGLMQEEFSLCTEMVQILPIKIQRLENELNQQ